MASALKGWQPLPKQFVISNFPGPLPPLFLRLSFTEDSFTAAFTDLAALWEQTKSKAQVLEQGYSQVGPPWLDVSIPASHYAVFEDLIKLVYAPYSHATIELEASDGNILLTTKVPIPTAGIFTWEYELVRATPARFKEVIIAPLWFSGFAMQLGLDMRNVDNPVTHNEASLTMMQTLINPAPQSQWWDDMIAQPSKPRPAQGVIESSRSAPGHSEKEEKMEDSPALTPKSFRKKARSLFGLDGADNEDDDRNGNDDDEQNADNDQNGDDVDQISDDNHSLNGHDEHDTQNSCKERNPDGNDD
ncbi:hypothetical protein EJ06DRAFT_553037 [Trichodelitschia bisporula]|uniref:XLF-like N-terminal domain-containing protein n=1 Tax=Trichodelitschia bisporula TaxID=703511 RepID=A0A6G1I7D6_9PEZI|nr:hypothetical protein EJ06DRAFT_553037 [Trichodelitschia bisporula]